MDEDGKKHVCIKRSDDRIEEVDRLRDLPDCLIFRILLNLSTKDVVKTSVLSSRWRTLWRYVPSLDLNFIDVLGKYKFYACPKAFVTFVTFVNRFLEFDSESCLQNLKLRYHWDALKSHLATWIDTAVERKVQHLHVFDGLWDNDQVYEVKITPRVYTCESLVSLKLSDVTLPIAEFVSLPSLKVIKLDMVKFADGWAFETLISGCPVLESLSIKRSYHYNVKVLRLCSNSLLSFTHISSFYNNVDKDLVVEIDAPVLEYLKLSLHETSDCIIYNLGSLVKVDINIMYMPSTIDPPRRNMVRNFLVGISNVKEMVISYDTLQLAMYDYSTSESLPLFHNLSFLHLNRFEYNKWNILLVFLETCPNLKSLFLEGCNMVPGKELVISVEPVPQCLKSSLEYLDIEILCFPEAMEMNLVNYFLENSTTLKKLALLLDTTGRRKHPSSSINSTPFQDSLPLADLSYPSMISGLLLKTLSFN